MNTQPNAVSAAHETQDQAPASALPIAVKVSKVHELAPWGRTTTFRLVRDGVLPAKRLGGTTLVLVEDITALIRDLEPVAPVG